MPDIPKIKKVNEIGETPFRVIEMKEKILQGWDKTARKMLYLFKGGLNNWCYYDAKTKQTVEVPEWRDKEALIMGRWVKMSLYYRLHIAFETPINYSEFSYGRGSQQHQTYEAIINLTKSAYEELEKQMVGRDPGSFYRFSYKKLASGMTVDGVYWVK